MASMPRRRDLPKIQKAKKAPVVEASSRQVSKESKRMSQEGREVSKQAVSAMAQTIGECAGGLTRTRQNKNVAQQSKEAAAELAQKDPFEDWRKNMVNENQMSMFQRQLRSEAGLQTLQGGLQDEARRFKNFWLKEIPDGHLFEDRTRYGPHGMKAAQINEKKLETFRSEHLGMHDEGLERTSTNTNLFKYFGQPADFQGTAPPLKALGKLLQKSTVYGANLDKLAMEEMKRQQADRAQERAARQLCKSPTSGFSRGFKRTSTNIGPGGSGPADRPHRTLSTSVGSLG